MFNFKKVLGLDPTDRALKRYREIVKVINSFSDSLKSASDGEIKARFTDLRSHVETDSDLDKILPEVFAIVREVSDREIGLRHYDVQLIGGIALHEGKIAEMKTGEGKTLVAPLDSRC